MSTRASPSSILVIHTEHPIIDSALAELARSFGWTGAIRSIQVSGSMKAGSIKERATAALRVLAGTTDGELLVLAAAEARITPSVLRDLHSALFEQNIDVVSPLDDVLPELSPLVEGASLEDASDRNWAHACAWLSEGRCHPTRALSPVLSVWRMSALRNLPWHESFDCERLPSSLNAVVFDRAFVASGQTRMQGPVHCIDPREARPAHTLDLLRARLSADASAWPAPMPDTVLHILHGWGGGAARFVNDFAHADTARQHLILEARGNSQRRCHGESLVLRLAGNPSLIVREFPLSAPIDSVVDSHPEVPAILQWIKQRHDVVQVMVSSVIGHSLDVLRTELPTQWIAHDYFPLWPNLHDAFEDPSKDFSIAAMEQTNHQNSPFLTRPASEWRGVRDSLVDALLQQHIPIIAPTQRVLANWKRIEPRLAGHSMIAIAHGIAPFAATYARRPRPQISQTEGNAAPLRIVVPGRINGAKGERLLRQLIPALNQHARFLLLGAGEAGMAFFGCSNCDVVLDYQRDELPKHLNDWQPDFALLPSTVPETFSYTLSEMWALGVPVVATQLGAFAERIEHGKNGWLLEPKVSAMADTFRHWHSDRSVLSAVLATQPGPVARVDSPWIAQYSATLATQINPNAKATPNRSNANAAVESIEHFSAAHFALLSTRQAQDLIEAQENQEQLKQEVAKRGEWGWSLDAKLRQQLQSNVKLQSEIEAIGAALHNSDAELSRARLDHATLQSEFDSRSRWAIQLDAEVSRLNRNILDLTQSTSWKLTKPLRFAARLLTAFRFRLARASQLLKRGLMSLKQRGLGATVSRLRDYHQRQTPTANAMAVLPTPSADEVSLDFCVPHSDTPTVSIIIPVYNQFHYTVACLRSIAEQGTDLPFEVIVVDDCSSDRSKQDLSRIQGIRVERNAENLGFIGACNRGATLARGEYLVFLNNDTQVRAAWLDALHRTFSTHPDTGLAGAKLVYPDGRLQEAGGIVFNDGSGWNYGRFDDPRDPRYQYVREVDYCSGAAIMIPRALFERFGGFDVRYKPAYYEDTDLAFQVRQAGLKVRYQPASEVVHFEGITSGTDTSSGTKRFQVVNQSKFLERWQSVLASHPAPPPQQPIEASREHRVKGRMLICDACTPKPDEDSGSVRMVNIMRALIELNWKVVFLNENRVHDGRYTEQLEQLGVECLHHPHVNDPLKWLREHGRLFDVVMLSRHYIAAPLLPVIREVAPQARIVFDTVDLHYLREMRAAEVEQSESMRRQAASTKNQELRLMRQSDVTVVVSPVEAELLAREAPQARVEILSNVHAVAGSGPAFEQRRDCFFIGGFQHQPNVDAVLWFVREIWPLLEARVPELKFHIVGSRTPPEIQTLASDRIIVHGWLENIDWLLNECRLSVAPLRYGAGVKGKVNMSMAHGQPVVATPIAMEGMHAVDGEDVLIAETPQAFADAVVCLYSDQTLWNRLATNALANIERHFSFDAAKRQLQKILP